MKQVFSLGLALSMWVFGGSAASVHANENCADEASVQRVEQQIADKQQEAKAREKQQQDELKAFLASEKLKKNWDEQKVQQVFATLLADKDFIALDAQKKPQTSALIKLIRELRGSKQGERNLANECQQAQQITAILDSILAVNQQQYEWMRRYIAQTP